MPLLSLVAVLAVVGLILWFVTTKIPMEPTIKNIIVGVVILAVVLWLLQVFGILGSVNTVQVPRLR